LFTLENTGQKTD